MVSGVKYLKPKKLREVIMNLGKEELSRRVKITIPLLEQVASMSAKRPKKHYWREIEAKREELELAREFAL